MEFLILLIQTLIGYFVAVAVHELSHISAGLLSGFRFELFVLGPFGLKRDEKGAVVSYYEKNRALWGGIAATVPVDEDEENLEKFANLIIAGPLTSLLFGI